MKNMSKTFKYYVITKSEYSPEIDETVEETEEFEYEVDDEELLDAVTDFIYDDYFSNTDISDILDV